MKTWRLPLAFSVLVTLSASGFSRAAFASEIALVGAANFPALSEDPSAGSSGVAGIGGGALAAVSLIPLMLDLQVGALYMQRRTNATLGLTTTGTTAKSLEVPVLVRFIPAPIFSVGAGAYFSQALGDLGQSVTVNSGATTSSSVSWSAANRAGTDFGLVASADVRFPLAKPFYLVADIRYLLGLRNVDTSGSATVRNRALEFLAGVSLSL